MKKMTLQFPAEVLAMAGYDTLDNYFHMIEKIELLERGEDETLHLIQATIKEGIAIDDIVGTFGISAVEVFYQNRNEYRFFCRMRTNRLRQRIIEVLDFSIYFTTPEYYDGDHYLTTFYIEDSNVGRLTQILTDLEVPYEIVAIKSPRQFQEHALTSLSPMQRHTLRCAKAHGYYHFPRDIDIGGIAERLGISKQAVHKHLCKAENKIMDAVLDR